jgi:ATP-dependent HslUV protease ATP-binding subunit HslU
MQTNTTVENIGARRLHTIVEKVMEDISFEASDKAGETIKVDAAYVTMKLKGLVQSVDMRKYIL